MKTLKNRPTAQDVVDYLEITPSELPSLLKKGLPAYAGKLGKEVRDLDSILKTKFTPDEKRLNELDKRVSRISKAPPPLILVIDNSLEIAKKRSLNKMYKDIQAHRAGMEKEIKKLRAKGVKKRPALQYPPGYNKYEWISFTRPKNDEDGSTWLQKIMTLWFKREEVLQFLKDNDSPFTSDKPLIAGVDKKKKFKDSSIPKKERKRRNHKQRKSERKPDHSRRNDLRSLIGISV